MASPSVPAAEILYMIVSIRIRPGRGSAREVSDGFGPDPVTI